MRSDDYWELFKLVRELPENVRDDLTTTAAMIRLSNPELTQDDDFLEIIRDCLDMILYIEIRQFQHEQKAT